MEKLKTKGFTLIELLAVIVIFAILVAVSIPAVTKYLTTARKGTYATNATTAIDAYRNYIVSNGITKDSSMTLAQLNGLLEKKLTTSSYGSAYEDFSTIYVTFDEALIPTYSICLVDEKGNGIYNIDTGQTISLLENQIKTANIKIGGEGITTCAREVTATVEEAFAFTGGAITDYDPLIGGTNIIIPDTIGGVPVTSIGVDAFRANGITSVVIPDSVTTIGSSAFRDDDITTLEISENVTSIGSSAFKGNELETVVIPDTVTTLGTGVFSYNKLTSATLPNGITTVPNSLFYGNLLTTITIPSSVTLIDLAAFSNNSITTVSIPGTVITVGSHAFYKNSISNLTLGVGIKTIGADAFRDNNLSIVTIPSSVTTISDEAFYKGTGSNLNLTKIINKTPNYFYWGNAVNASYNTTFFFQYGTITNSLGNVVVASS